MYGLHWFTLVYIYHSWMRGDVQHILRKPGQQWFPVTFPLDQSDYSFNRLPLVMFSIKPTSQ
jgi:hypothetical protein